VWSPRADDHQTHTNDIHQTHTNAAAKSGGRFRVLGLVLAAGRSARMGRPKQLAELSGRPLLEHALAAMSAAPVDDVAVALGARAGEVLAAVDLHRARPLVVEGWAEGMGRVLARAVATALPPEAREALPPEAREALPPEAREALPPEAREAGHGYGAVVVALGDQPLVTAGVVARLVDAWAHGAGPVVTATYGGRPGHPKLFDRAVLPHLCELAGDAGARELLARHPEWVAGVEVAVLGSDLDVDDEPGLARAAALLAGRQPAPSPTPAGRGAQR